MLSALRRGPQQAPIEQYDFLIPSVDGARAVVGRPLPWDSVTVFSHWRCRRALCDVAAFARGLIVSL
jgi:hypothetical protein